MPNDTTAISLVEEMRQIKGLVIQTQEAINNLQLQVNSFVNSIKLSSSQQGKAAETFACQTEIESSDTVESEKNEESKPSSSDDTDDSTEFEVIRQSTKGINKLYRYFQILKRINHFIDIIFVLSISSSGQENRT